MVKGDSLQPVPPLPEPAPEGRESTPDQRRAMSHRFIVQARNELRQGNRLQAGEKAWGAVAQQLKIVGQARGWGHRGHRQMESIGRHIRSEYPDLASQPLADALSDAYHKGHDNFYENHRTWEEIEEVVEAVERELPALERLATEAANSPRPFQIQGASALRRLREITGNSELKVGDRSDVGFSLKHSLPGVAAMLLRPTHRGRPALGEPLFINSHRL